MKVKKMSLTKKHFEQLAKVMGQAYKHRRNGNLDQAFISFDQGIMNLCINSNPRFDSILFARKVSEYSK